MNDDMPQPAPGMISLDQAARLLMLTERRIQQLAAEGYIPKPTRGSYPLVGAVQGYLRFRDEVERRQAETTTEGNLKTTRQAEIQQRIDERRSLLVNRAEAETSIDIIVGLVREHIEDVAPTIDAAPPLLRSIGDELQAALTSIDRVSSRAKAGLAQRSG